MYLYFSGSVSRRIHWRELHHGESNAVLSDLNKLAATNASAAELSILKGMTIPGTTSIELNKLYGYAGVSTGASNELNYVVGVTPGIPAAQKAVIANANGAMNYLFVDATSFSTGATLPATAQSVSLSVSASSPNLTLPAIASATSIGYRYVMVVTPVTNTPWTILGNNVKVNNVPHLRRRVQDRYLRHYPGSDVYDRHHCCVDLRLGRSIWVLHIHCHHWDHPDGQSSHYRHLRSIGCLCDGRRHRHSAADCKYGRRRDIVY